MDTQILLKRLSLIKYLYAQGTALSNQPELIAFPSILLFHDSIEMFLKLASLERNVKSDKFSFIEYWVAIPELTLKASMDSFNKLRVNLKHHGLLPSKLDLETARVNVTDFFKQNTPIIFNLAFEDISLLDLITFENTKALLIKAQEHLKKNEFSESVQESTKAFYELLYDYTKSKLHHQSGDKFNFTKQVKFNKWGDYNGEIKRVFDDFTNDVNSNFESLNEVLEILSLGIDYKKYTKFKILTPITIRMYNGKYHMQIFGERIWNIENCLFLIDFVLESAIKIQEFDYDVNSVHLGDGLPTIYVKRS
jgi:hypothetical protein